MLMKPTDIVCFKKNGANGTVLFVYMEREIRFVISL